MQKKLEKLVRFFLLSSIDMFSTLSSSFTLGLSHVHYRLPRRKNICLPGFGSASFFLF